MALFTGLARWVSFDAIKSIAIGIGCAILLGLAVSIYSDIKTSGGSQARLQCAQAVIDGNEQAAKEIDALNAKAVQAANAEREKAKAEVAQTAERVVTLEASLRALTDDPICYPQSISRSLRQ
jgi:hypothetical protein